MIVSCCLILCFFLKSKSQYRQIIISKHLTVVLFCVLITKKPQVTTPFLTMSIFIGKFQMLIHNNDFSKFQWPFLKKLVKDFFWLNFMRSKFLSESSYIFHFIKNRLLYKHCSKAMCTYSYGCCDSFRNHSSGKISVQN